LRKLIHLPETCPDCGEGNWTFLFQDGEKVDIPRECACRRTLREKHEKAMLEMEQKSKQERIQQLFESSMLSPRFRTNTFDSFETFKRHNDSVTFAFGTAQRYAKNFNSVRSKPQNGIIFTGTTGVGKTHLAAAIANHLLNQGIPVVFGTMADFLQRIKDGFNGDDTDTMKILQTVDLLVIDDLGKENHSKWVTEQVFTIINSRYANNLPTVITTEFTAKNLRDMFIPAVVSRFTESYYPIKITADDYRPQILKGERK